MSVFVTDLCLAPPDQPVDPTDLAIKVNGSTQPSRPVLLYTFTRLPAPKQIEDAFDTIVSLVRQQANRFFIRKVISICHIWVALRLRFAFIANLLFLFL